MPVLMKDGEVYYTDCETALYALKRFIEQMHILSPEDLKAIQEDKQ